MGNREKSAILGKHNPPKVWFIGLLQRYCDDVHMTMMQCQDEQIIFLTILYSFQPCVI